MRDESPAAELPREDVLFAELIVAQGLSSRAKVDECLSLLRGLLAAGVQPVPRLGELLVRKGYLTTSEVEQTLRRSQTSPAEPGPPKPSELPPEAAEAARDPAHRIGRYVRTRRLGAGGMGEVWRAWDPDLRRWVALKFLKGDDPEEIARFEREAQTAAKLSHPNIAAVYEVGSHADRPYIAMQLVEGKTLATFPRDDRRLLVEIVREAALAVHEAHEQGVIHRDLKPYNLMVEARSPGKPKTARREAAASRLAGLRVYVMDFGLARQTSLDSSLSVSGNVLGTPAYMPPEQARGQLHACDARSDVYSFGATLYELLTDRPPLRADSVYDLLRKVMEEDPLPVRKLNPKVDRDLETIVMKCLEKEPARRYASAQELADDLDRYLAGEPIAARPASPLYRLRKMVARRRGYVAAGSVTAAALAALVLVFALSRRETGHARLYQKGQDLWTKAVVYTSGMLQLEKARETAREARTLFEEANRVLETPAAHWMRGRCFQLEGNDRQAEAAWERALELDPGFPGARFELAKAMLLNYHESRGTPPIVSPAYGGPPRFGTLGPESPEQKALRERAERLLGSGRGTGVEEELLQALHAMGRGAFDQAGPRLARYVKAESWDDRAMTMEGICLYFVRDFEGAVRALDRAAALRPRPTTYCWRARARCARGEYAKAVEDLTLALQLDPDLSTAYVDRGISKRGLDDLEGAIRDFTKAVELSPRHAEAYSCRGNARRAAGDIDGALKDFDRAIELQPGSALAYSNRSNSKRIKGDLDGAIQDCDRSIELDPTYAAPYINRGNAWKLKGEHEKALRDFTKAIEVDPESSMAYLARGRTLRERGDADGALRDLGKALELDPRDADVFLNRGIARWDKRDLQGAIEDFTQAIELDPKSSDAFAHRGAVRGSQGDFKNAMSDLDRALALDPKSVPALLYRGDFKVRRGDVDGGIRDLDRAIELAPRNARAHALRGHARRMKWQLDLAIADCTRAVEFDPRDPTGYTNRAEARINKGDLQGTIQDCDAAIAIRADNADAFQFRAMAKQRKGDLDGAIADATEALKLEPQRTDSYETRAIARERKGDRKGAIEDFDAAVALAPRNPVLLHNRGVTRFQGGDWEGAIADATAALGIDPRRADAFILRGNARAKRNELDPALEDFRRALELRAGNPDILYTLGCLHARKASADPAFEYLGKAIDAGFRKADQIAKDADLESLRSDPRWAPLLARLKR